MFRKYRPFLHLYDFQLPKQTRQTHWYLQCFEETTCQKSRFFETIFHIFSARAPPFKNQSFFAPFFPLLIRTQEGVKSQKVAVNSSVL